ncbi:MAG: hypothetical protein ACREER_12070, partial [Alphaproteobacteria bacterium]
MQPGYEGWAALGDMIGGGGKARAENAYVDQFHKAQVARRSQFDADTAEAKARQEQLQAIAHAGLPQQYEQLGLGDYAGIVQAGGGNASQLMEALAKARADMLRQRAVAAAPGQGYDPVNSALIGLANGPLQVNKITSGEQYNPYLANGEVDPTALGESAIAKNRAMGEAALIRANRPPASGRAPADHTRAERASTLRAIVPRIEKDMGRKLTTEEYLTLQEQYL